MKIWRFAFALLLAVSITWMAAAQKNSNEPLPRYDKSTEAVFKGTVEEVKDRNCPVSGGVGSHLMLKLADNRAIEVHLSLTRFVNQYEPVFHQGDVLEVTGAKVKFEGGDTILARKIKRGQDEYLFRDGEGKPLW